MRAAIIRPSRPALYAVAALLLLVAGPALAQENRDLQCIQQYNALVDALRRLDPTDPRQVARGCQLVAEAVRGDWPAEALFAAPAAAPRVDPRDLSATRDQTTTSPGETTAPIEPVEAAGGSVAAVGTDKGAGAVAAVAINPSIFFIDPSDSEQVARWSRFTDLTLLVPASDLDGEEGEEEDEERTDYVGIRWGVNLTGLRQGSEMHQAVVNAYDAFLATGTSQNAQIQQLLRNAGTEDELKGCIQAMVAARSLTAQEVTSITTACGGAPDPTDAGTITRLRDAIQAARIQADSRYFGLDLRADFGDLTLAGVDTLEGTSFFAGVGWGRRSVRNTQAATGIRAHLGARYWDLEGEDDANLSVEGGVAFEAIRFYNYQRLTLVGGVDVQHRTGGEDGDEDDKEDTSINLRGTLNVPITPTASVSVVLAAPVVGERRGPVLSIKGNWRLLRSLSF